MDFFSSLPISALWIMLAFAAPFALLSISFLTAALKSGEIKLFGRTIAQKANSPAIFWAIWGDSVFVAGLSVFVIISVLVELFLVRA